MSPTRIHKTIHWFRKGLRLHDNPALLAACQSSTQLWPVFVLDPWFVKNGRVGINRWRFLVQALEDLDKSLQKVNARLYVVKGKPSEVFPKLFEDWGISQLTYEVDTEPYAKERDAQVEAIAEKQEVKVVKHISHTLYDTDKVLSKNGGSPPLTYQRCQTVLSQLGTPPKPMPTVTSQHFSECSCPTDKDYEAKYGVPSLEDMGLNPENAGPVFYPGGETEALHRLDKHIKRTNWICGFEKPKTEPNTLEPSTTVLSPYLKFGCLSARTFYHKLQDVFSSSKKRSQPPVSLDGQLLWREFFYHIGASTPNFDKMEGNSVCRQIPWDDNKEYLEAWTHGRTGYPFIDAIMRQLRAEGWIHHLARHAVACFLTRGDLWCSWEEGQKVFEELLLDADWSLNAGNWMWLSASAFFHQYFRVYSPIAFGKKTDKDGAYIKKYIPILKKYPSQYIYEPWKAPLSVQKAAGCIIGKDYPRPLVDHDEMRKKNISRMAAAYNAAKESAAANGGAKGKATPGKRKSVAEGSAPARKKKPSGNKKITDFTKSK